jgi:hypothetical protein
VTLLAGIVTVTAPADEAEKAPNARNAVREAAPKVTRFVTNIDTFLNSKN